MMRNLKGTHHDDASEGARTTPMVLHLQTWADRIEWRGRTYTKWTSVETATPAQIRHHLERLIDDRERINAEITDLKRRAAVMTA